MSEARPEKHDSRRHDSQDGVVLPNLSRFRWHTECAISYNCYIVMSTVVSYNS